MVVWSTTTYVIRIYHHQSCELESRSSWGVFDTTLCDNVCRWPVAGQWFFPFSSTNKLDRHDIAEILLKVALSTITIQYSTIVETEKKPTTLTQVTYRLCWLSTSTTSTQSLGYVSIVNTWVRTHPTQILVRNFLIRTLSYLRLCFI